MKTLKFMAILALALLVSGNVMAKKTKKQKKAEKVEVVAKPDTVSMHDFCYAFGIAQTRGLMEHLATRVNVDTAQYYMNIFIAGLNTTELTPAAKEHKAWAAGYDIRQELESSLVPYVNKNLPEGSEPLDMEAFFKGFSEGINNQATMTTDSATKITEKQMEYYKKVIEDRKSGAGKAFLEENAKKEGVKVTASGLQYKVITEGKGAVPAKTDRVKVNYEGRLIDGTIFDSSYQRNQPATFGCNQVIAGWTEALTMMPVGSKWELYIPQELGYGAREAGKIPPYSTLIFTVELLDIEK